MRFLFLSIINIVSCLNIIRVGNINARTTLHLWNELYVAKQKSHDFFQIYSPLKKREFFIGIFMNDEIRAIAKCERNDTTSIIHSVAYGPEQYEYGENLISILADRNYTMKNIHQPSMFLEYCFKLS